MLFTKKIKKILLNLTALTSLTLAVITPAIVASQKINAKGFLLFPGIALLANENNVVQLAQRYDKYYYFGISLIGHQHLSYYGGWFYQDKISWTGKARTKFRPRNSYYSNPDKLELKVTSWISGMGSSSFSVGGEIKYDGKFSAKASANTGVSIDSNGYLVDSITNYNHRYAGIDYDFHGWKYKVTTFGSSASAHAKYKYKTASILSDSSYHRVSWLSESLEE
ncbi:hypothetical protein [Mesomycoplasma hyopneumoniae]|uniref:Uncharacterized protein n=1 Tax=Mesomycoplasma hyopneumoniae (strain 232) TaxID=295358 RepID=Q600V0_MESH2|nr:hypothetical protein [Mesomycoplasma hyopneumoniae]AAV27845.1 hypothetical protein mhp354 [Mesomycoplasma hyopneumoniae 232]OWG13955.1 hypothetical protein B5C39_03360 [Mesomycoplasma hyopneumoniae]VEU65334.1 Uncharacterised protein [Mesomycoplasma hyopneumoniae]